MILDMGSFVIGALLTSSVGLIVWKLTLKASEAELNRLRADLAIRPQIEAQADQIGILSQTLESLDRNVGKAITLMMREQEIQTSPTLGAMRISDQPTRLTPPLAPELAARS